MVYSLLKKCKYNLKHFVPCFRFTFESSKAVSKLLLMGGRDEMKLIKSVNSLKRRPINQVIFLFVWRGGLNKIN